MSSKGYEHWLEEPDVKKQLAPIKKLQGVLLEILKTIDNVCEENGIRYYLWGGTLLGALRHGGFIPWDDDADIAMPREDYERLLHLPRDKWPSGYFLQSPYSEKYGRFAFAKLRRDGTACIDPHHKHIKMHHGIFVDIFPLDRMKNRSVLLWTVPRLFERMAALKCARLPDSMKLLKPLKWIWEAVAPPASNFNKMGNFFACFLSCRKGDRYLSTFSPARGGKIRAGWGVDCFEPVRRINFEGCQLAIPGCSEEILRACYGNWHDWPPEEDRMPVHSVGGVIDTKRDYTEYLKDNVYVE